jgi:hypothetical protein
MSPMCVNKQLSATIAFIVVLLFANLSIAQFSLVSSSPKRNAIGVSVNEIPVLQFSENVDAATVGNGFTLVSNLRGKITYTASVIANSVTITPSDPFTYSEEVTISILAGLRSTSAASLSIPTAFRFETMAKVSVVIPPNFVSREIARMTDQPIRVIATADLDGDSDLDICFAGPKMGWLENDGQGEFSTHDIATVTDNPSDIKLFDIDQDSDIDIITASTFIGIVIYRNDGQENFMAGAPIVGAGVPKIDIVDFNADGLFDIVYSGVERVDDRYVEGSYILYQDATGRFNKTKIGSVATQGTKCVDIDNDGDWDILQYSDSEIYYLLNTGTESVVSELMLALPDTRILDFTPATLNTDEYTDLIVVTTGSYSTDVHTLFNDGNYHFSSVTLATDYVVSFTTAGDFDGDRDTDIILIDGNYNYVTFENDGEGIFIRKMLGLKGETPYSPGNTVNGDFNGDGDLDFVSVPSYYFIELFDNTVFPFASDLSAGIKPLTSADADWGDFDGDGDLDLLTTGINEGGSPEAIIYQNQAGVLKASATTITPVWLGSCDWGDFDNDGDLDILMMGGTSMNIDDRKPQTFVYRNENNEFVLIPESVSQLPKAWYGKARWADMNNDGLLDIVFNANGFSGIYKSDGKGNFAKACELPFVFQYGNVGVGDYDNDGDLDLSVSGWNGSAARVNVFRNDGNWEMHEVAGDFSGIYGGNLNWADMDSDGDLDLVASGQKRFEDGGGVPAVIVCKNEDGVFQPIENSELLYHTDQDGTTAAGDYDNDGIPDIIASTKGGSSYDPMLTLLKNNGKGDLSSVDVVLPRIVTRVANWVDYDLDHDLDLFAGSQLVRNNVDKKNTPPTKPTNIQADSVYNNAIYLKWNPATDNETAQPGLSYQIFVGTQSHAQDIVNANANLANGFKKIAEGGSSKGTKTIVTNLEGGDYFFGVQSIDAAFEGSAFSDEGHFNVIGIHGPQSSCSNIEVPYFAKPSGNYTWQVIGGTIISGEGSDNITVRWDTIGKGYIKISNGEGSKNTLEVYLDEIPEPIITGDETVCTGQEMYLLSDLRSHQVEWNISGITLENQFSTTATITWAESGQFEVNATAYPEHKGCFAEAKFSVSVDKRPDPTITQVFNACEGSEVEFSTRAINPDWNVVGGTFVEHDRQSIMAKWANSGTGSVSVEANSARAFCRESDEIIVPVYPLPEKPYLEILQDTIVFTPTPSPSGYYRWFYEDELMFVGPYEGVIPFVSGYFSVEVVSQEGCGNKSDPFYYDYVVVTSTEELLPLEFGLLEVYPNPADWTINLKLPDTTGGRCELEIYSAMNSLVASYDYADIGLLSNSEIDVSSLAPGVYLALVRTNEATYQTKFVKR